MDVLRRNQFVCFAQDKQSTLKWIDFRGVENYSIEKKKFGHAHLYMHISLAQFVFF